MSQSLLLALPLLVIIRTSVLLTSQMLPTLTCFSMSSVRVYFFSDLQYSARHSYSISSLMWMCDINFWLSFSGIHFSNHVLLICCDVLLSYEWVCVVSNVIMWTFHCDVYILRLDARSAKWYAMLFECFCVLLTHYYQCISLSNCQTFLCWSYYCKKEIWA